MIKEGSAVKTKYWLLLMGGILLVCALLSIPLLTGGQADYADIYSDGKLLYTMDLRIDREETVRSEYGMNVVTVKDGAIAVTHADCPDGYCMKRGYCSGGTEIVCLPNRMVIRFGAQQAIDAAVG